MGVYLALTCTSHSQTGEVSIIMRVVNYMYCMEAYEVAIAIVIAFTV